MAAVRPGPVQILSLGAGFDTTFWQLHKAGVAPTRYIELDTAEVCRAKTAIIGRTHVLLQALGPSELPQPGHDPASGTWLSPCYRLAPADLRHPQEVAKALQLAGLDPAAPTLVLSECVLVYITRAESDAVLRQVAGMLSTAAVVIYEQIRPDDAFGRQMLLNLEARGCPLLGICQDLKDQERRLRAAGWDRAEAASMGTIYRHLEASDRRRIERLEIFDEFEEWDLIHAHYCIALGVKDASGNLSDFSLLHTAPSRSRGT